MARTKSFSERIGIVQPPDTPYIDEVPGPLRNSIWNVVLDVVGDGDNWDHAVRIFAQYFFKLPVDDLPYYPYEKRDWLKRHFYDLSWFRQLDFVDFVAQYAEAIASIGVSPEKVIFRLNDVLEEEHSGYRIVERVLSPITSTVEREAIENSLSNARGAGFEGVAAHIQSALALLSKRPDPDYRNSIKESISAVESAARQLAPDARGNGLGARLDHLVRRHGIHQAFRNGLLALYGYTSDSGGIRHALLSDDVTPTFADAQFMLVACSAFTHYLMLKSSEPEVTG